MEQLTDTPAQGRTFGSRRRIRLSDTDAGGRLRLDAVARYLQDVASDDVDETGWGAPDHLWVVRRYRVDVLAPFVHDREVELLTWCNGLAPVAAGRRTSLTGDAGGLIEVDSVWIHLGSDGRPARLDDGFGVYAAAAAGRRVSTRLSLGGPPHDAARTPWQVRATDVDVMGHLNNAVHWQAVEDALGALGVDPSRPFCAVLEYRHPIDLGEAVTLATFADGDRPALALEVDGEPRAVASVARRRG